MADEEEIDRERVFERRRVDVQEKRRRRRERWLLAVVAIAIVAVTYVEFRLSRFAEGLPTNNLLFFALVNVNVILTLLLVFLVFRNVAKLVFDRRSSAVGARLRTKLVVAFAGFTLLPSVLLFAVTTGFVVNSVNSWFDPFVQTSLNDALQVAHLHYQLVEDENEHFAARIATAAEDQELLDPAASSALHLAMEAKRDDFRLHAVQVFDATGSVLFESTDPKAIPGELPVAGEDFLATALDSSMSVARIWPLKADEGDVLRAIAPVFPKGCPEHSRTRKGEPIRGCRPVGAVVVTTVIPGDITVHTNRIHRALTGHFQVKVFQGPLTTTYVTMLSTITLLVVFAGTWLGMRLAKAIAVPLNDLAGATRAVSQGNYDVVVPDPGGDEIGQVVGAFNRMTGDLKASRSRLQAANADLEARRRYMEVVLENIGAGVVALDRTGHITAMNDAAARLLALDDPRGPIGRHHTDVLPETYSGLAREIVRELETSPVASLSRQVTISIKGETKTVSLTVTALRDEGQGYLGMVAVLDDLTPILRGQRVAAWREVARRIAHEIKNPLTPIQLSAQRLHRRFAPAITEGREVFDECTTTIETQVEELRRMVNEFSEFARMPEARPAPNDLNAVAGEAVSLYKNAHAGIEIAFTPDSAVPVFDLDREQLKRGVINLLENAVQALHEGGGTRVDISTDYDVKLGIVRLVVADDGPGISAEVKNRLFEPYFSTKKTGTGLGLTIVHRIVADHEGFIRVQDNRPRGTRMVIELPAKGATGGAGGRGQVTEPVSRGTRESNA